MEKHAFCMCENKDPDQHLCFRYNPSTSGIRNLKLLTVFCGSPDWFVLDLVGNPKDRFSHVDRDCVIREDTEQKEMSITDDALIPLKCGKKNLSNRECRT